LYPTGALGLGLLFLRASAALFLAFDYQLSSPAILIGVVVVASALVLGFLTRIAAAAGATAMIALALANPAAPITLLAGECLMLAAIALLGAGAIRSTASCSAGGQSMSRASLGSILHRVVASCPLQGCPGDRPGPTIDTVNRGSSA